nr:MAG TPA_asm: hypothetical protein [Bacteriophage sp.]
MVLKNINKELINIIINIHRLSLSQSLKQRSFTSYRISQKTQKKQ